MSLESVTPVVLTKDEEANVGRTLASLAAFPRVVVVDSGSTDRTGTIVRGFPNVSWFVREWQGFGRQWEFALRETSITTPFVLALDADMSVTEGLAKELAEVTERDGVDGGAIGFEYRIEGVPLAGSLYPAQLRLLRVARARVGEAGHAHLLEVDGPVASLRNCLVHDDRKPLEAFVRAQLGYSARELACLYGEKSGTFAGRVRRSFPFTPLAVWAWAWLRAGGPFRGAAARRYALERLLYESMLRWRVEDELLRRPVGDGSAGRAADGEAGSRTMRGGDDETP